MAQPLGRRLPWGGFEQLRNHGSTRWENNSPIRFRPAGHSDTSGWHCSKPRDAERTSPAWHSPRRHRAHSSTVQLVIVQQVQGCSLQKVFIRGVYYPVWSSFKCRQSMPAWYSLLPLVCLPPALLREEKAGNCVLMAQLVLMLRGVDCLVTTILCTELIVVKANEWSGNKQTTRK